MVNRLVFNKTAYFGAGSIQHIPEELKKLGAERVLVITDSGLVKCGVTAKVTGLLAKARIVHQVFEDVYANPTVANVKAGFSFATQFRAQAIVAVGGGSVLDAAKAVALMCGNPDLTDIRKLEKSPLAKNPSVPLIAVSTAFGSGAEFSSRLMLTDMNSQRKIVCSDPNCIPLVSVMDSDFYEGLSARLCAQFAVEALALAVEGYISDGAWGLGEQYCLEAVRLIAENLKPALNNSLKAREQLGYAQYLAGMGAQTNGLGLLHSLSHPLEAVYDLPHGIVSAVLLKPVLTFNASSSAAKYKDLALALGARLSSKAAPAEYRKTCIACVDKLLAQTALPLRLSKLDVHLKDVDFLSDSVLKDVCLAENPKEISRRKIAEIYKSIA